MIKFINDIRQVGGFLRVVRFPPPNKTDRHDITERLLKVALSTTTLTPINIWVKIFSWSAIHVFVELDIAWTSTTWTRYICSFHMDFFSSWMTWSSAGNEADYSRGLSHTDTRCSKTPRVCNKGFSLAYIYILDIIDLNNKY